MNVLIYMKESLLKPVGGSTGYIFNLRQGMLKEEQGSSDIKISFLQNDTKIEQNEKTKQKNQIRILLYRIKYLCKLLSNISHHTSNLDLNKYDVIHFHDPISMYSIRDDLKKYNGIILLTCHSPKPFYRETYEDVYTNLERKVLKIFYKQLEKIDIYAFNMANYIVFPCEEAKEPYLKWSYFNTIPEEKFKYMLSGIEEKEITEIDYKKDLNIPDDTFVCSYVGRHNEVKGYNKLKENILPRLNERFQIVVCGKEGPLYAPNNEYWHEIGWTNNALAYVKNSNLFILPNNETYFDLVLLEVLASGTLCLISNTGGNKYFKKFEGNSGIFFYSNRDEFNEKINEIMTLSNDEIDKLKLENRKIFENYFNEVKFFERYKELIKNLY